MNYKPPQPLAAPPLLRVYLVDDEPLAVRRLTRLLNDTGAVEIRGGTTEVETALREIPGLAANLDAVFLDVQMPGLNGFELLARLETYPPVVFTTAFDHYAVQAFEVHSIDYLLKPVGAERLAKTLDKLRIRRDEKSSNNLELQQLIERAAAALTHRQDAPARSLERLASRTGGRVQFVEIAQITHFFAEDKLVFAHTADNKLFPVDFSVHELEQRLANQNFVRIHRRALVSADWIETVHGWFSGCVLVRLKDRQKTELTVARDRVRVLKDFLEI